jgi:phenylalanyl-tRNA synthetase beta subunit
MIKLKQVSTVLGKVSLIFEADFPDGTTKTVEVDVGELEERLKQLRQLLGRDLTTDDLRDVLKTLFNQLRQGQQPFPQKFDYNSLIGVDFEQ